ncbi:MAG: tRNA pseudouridine(55) synthase TruB [Patescibacteria group bacterium]
MVFRREVFAMTPDSLSGILVVDKPSGMTSHDVVFRVRRILGVDAVGHTGTLDPMASGILVLCVGRATKIARYLVERDKTYLSTFLVGRATDTDDITGKTVAEAAVADLPDQLVDETLSSFLGFSEQMPPAYAAIKVEGRKLYDYARAGQPIPQVAARPVEIRTLTRTSPVLKDGTTVRFDVLADVSKGTYIRAIARDFGSRIGLPATLAALRRTRVDRFEIDDAITLERLAEGARPLLDPLSFLDFPRVSLSPDLVFKAKNGAFLPRAITSADAVVVIDGDTPIAIYRSDPDKGIMRLEVML